MTPFILGIAGGSGAGKSTFAQKIISSLPAGAVLLLQHDSYYKDLRNLSFEDRAKVNYDHPDSLDTDLFVEHLKALKKNEVIQQPQYDFTSHLRLHETITVAPKPIIIVDGILIFVNEALRNEMELKIYLDADADTRLLRRLDRDIRERKRSIESVRKQYLDTVKPMHEQFVEPSKKFADLILQGDSSQESVVRFIVNGLQDIIKARCK